MSDFKSVKQLCEENPNLNNHILSLTDVIAKLEVNNIDLTNKNIKLVNELNEYSKCTSRCQPPTKSYKELEEKLAQAEELRQKDIDELFETRITPLNKQIIELKQQLTTSYDVNQGQKNRIRDLEIVRDNLNRMIDFAVGYISATQPHTDKHPMEIKQWLFKGLE